MGTYSAWESTATLRLFGSARRGEERGGAYCVATRTACSCRPCIFLGQTKLFTSSLIKSHEGFLALPLCVVHFYQPASSHSVRLNQRHLYTQHVHANRHQISHNTSDGRTDRPDRQTDGQTDRQTDRQTRPTTTTLLYCVDVDNEPGRKMHTDRRTDRGTTRQTD